MPKKNDNISKFLNKAKSISEYIQDKVSIKQLISKKGIEGIYQEFKIKNNRTFQILRYQKIIEPEKSLIPLNQDAFISPDNFRAHCKFIRENCNPLSMSELIFYLSNNKPIPEKSVVITFDGGFLQTYLNATPILLEYNIPATFLVLSSFIGQNTLFPEDRISYACAYLESIKHSVPFTKSLGDLLSIKESEAPKVIHFNSKIKDIFVLAYKTLPEIEQQKMLQGFNEIFLKDINIPTPQHEFMEVKDLLHLESIGFEIGSMGHTYGNMFLRISELVDKDLNYSFEFLRDNNINPISCFAPPNGIIIKKIPEDLKNSSPIITLGIDCHNEHINSNPPKFLLTRKRVFEGNTNSKDLFTVFLWEAL